jgi:hypothetical protein
VCERLFGGESLCGIRIEEGANESFCFVCVCAESADIRSGAEGTNVTFFGHVVPISVVEGDLRFCRLSHEFFHNVRAEWGVSAEKHVCNDPVGDEFSNSSARKQKEIFVPDGPEVDGLAVALLIEHLWGHIAEASSKGHELLLRGM